MTRGIYVASRATERMADMWNGYRANGVPIISTWIDEVEEAATADLGELWARIHREVVSAERFVLYATAACFPLKGALVEAGMAIAAGVPVFVVLAPDVVLEQPSWRPLGSWARHPSVRILPTLVDAFLEPIR